MSNIIDPDATVVNPINVTEYLKEEVTQENHQDAIKQCEEELNQIKQNSESECFCKDFCKCISPYEVKVKVVTRLAGIPVEGVQLIVNNNIYYSEAKTGEFISFEATKPSLQLELIYDTKEKGFIPEKMEVNITNLLPSCKSINKAKASFSHKILKLLDVAEDELDKDFIDIYTIKAKNYSPPSEDKTTSPIPGSIYTNVHSELQIIEPENKEKMIVYLNVSLATFSLNVQYMSQLHSHVKIESFSSLKLKPKNFIEHWNPISLSGLKYSEEKIPHHTLTKMPTNEVNYYELNPWHGERLC